MAMIDENTAFFLNTNKKLQVLASFFFFFFSRIEQLFLNSQQTIICMSNDHAQMEYQGNIRQAEERVQMQ